MGARIQLRLDGSDNTNDFWELVDSQAIKPIGYTEQHGGMLQPPLGFRKNPAHWPIFVTNTLSGAVIAPESCFKPTPRSPTRNYFTEGSKLEAVDKKNPRLICPATIQRVKDDMVFVSFDGWKGAFDYWSRYDSRDLFPVGWCQKSNHPLQLPGNKDLKISESKLSWVWPSKVPLQTINKTSSRTGTVLPLRQVTTSPTNGSGTKDGVKENLSTQPTVLSQSPPSSIKTIPIEPSTSTTTSTTATVTSNTSASPTTHNSKCTPTPQDLKVNIPICKSNLNNTSPTKKSPEETSAVKKEAPTPAVIAPESKSSQHTNSSPLTLKPAPTQVTSSKSVPLVDKTRASPSNATFPRFPLITVYINNTCFGGPHLVPEMLQKLPKQFGPGTLNKTMQDVIQMLLNCSKDRRYTFGLLRPGNGSFIVTGSVAGQKVRMTLPHFNRGVAFWNYLLNVLGGLDCCVNFISSSESQSKCTSCVGNSVTNVSTASPAMLSNKNPDKTTSSSQNRKLKNDSASSNRSGSAKRSASISLLEEAKDVTVKREKTVSTSSSTITEAEFSNPLDWSIDDVIKYLLTNDPTLEYAEVFRTHVSNS